MSPNEQDLSWLSGHLYFGDDISGRDSVYGAVCDRVVLDVVAPLVEQCRDNQWITRYFFIRFGDEYGQHVRLRFQGVPGLLEQRVKPLMSDWVRGVASSSGPLANPPLVLRWIPYEPEVERYGGLEGLRLAERCFQYSSDTALSILDQTPIGPSGARKGKALLLMTLLLYAFLEGREQAADLARHYSINYLRALAPNSSHQEGLLQRFQQGFDRQAETLTLYVDALWAELEEGGGLPDTLARYRAQLIDIRTRFEALFQSRALIRERKSFEQWLPCVYAIVPSYLHMMNNRIGVSLHEESYLAYLLTLAFNQRHPLSVS